MSIGGIGVFGVLIGYVILFSKRLHAGKNGFIIALAMIAVLVLFTVQYWDFIYEIIVGKEIDTVSIKNVKNRIKKLNTNDRIKLLIKTIIFENIGGGKIFEKLSLLDPLRERKEEIDNMLIEFNTAINILDVVEEKAILNENQYVKDLIMSSDDNSIEEVIKYIIRNIKFNRNNSEELYMDYIKYLYITNINLKGDEIRNLYKKVTKAIHFWNGNNIDDERINVFLGKKQVRYKISQKLEIEQERRDSQIIEKEELNKFLPFIKMYYRVDDKKFEIDIDYFLYELLIKVGNGYKLNKKDLNNNIKFDNFIKEISEYGEGNKELIVEDRINRFRFRLKKEGYDDGKFVFKELL